MLALQLSKISGQCNAQSPSTTASQQHHRLRRSQAESAHSTQMAVHVQVLFASLTGWAIFHEDLSLMTILGSLVIFAGMLAATIGKAPQKSKLSDIGERTLQQHH